MSALDEVARWLGYVDMFALAVVALWCLGIEGVRWVRGPGRVELEPTLGSVVRVRDERRSA